MKLQHKVAIGGTVVVSAFILSIAAFSNLSPSRVPSGEVKVPGFGISEEYTVGNKAEMGYDSSISPVYPIVPEQESVAGDKEIKNYKLEMETKEFDDLIEKITLKTKDLKGYIVSTNIWMDESGQFSHKVGNITLRVPVEKDFEMIEYIKKSGEIKRESSTASNVTKQYMDLEAQIESLKNQEKQLNDFYSKAKTIEELMHIDGKMREVVREREQLERNFIGLKDQVTYIDVQLSITEVVVFSDTTTIQVKPVERIYKSFLNSFTVFKEILIDALVFIASLTPFLILLSLGAGLGIYFNKKRKGKK